nr:PHP domain-containing protein [Candidatus Enterousia merdequi]
MPDFVHLHVHSKISVGASTLSVASNKKLGILKGIPELCRDNSMFACALTDTNMMSGCAEFSDVMPSNKLQPIIGVELSLNHHSADPKILRQSSLSKIVLLAKHHEGYLNLCELSRIIYMRQENHHLGPYITLSELKAHKDD